MDRTRRCIAAALAVIMFWSAGPIGPGSAWAQSQALVPGGLWGPTDGTHDRAVEREADRSLAAATGSVLAIGGLDKPREGASDRRPFAPLSAERAQVLLRSLTVPGWGQATLGHQTSARIFALAELGVWATFTAFRIQTKLRRESSERSARILAGIDLSDRDEEFHRIVGAFLSSDEYNQLVVFRDAANLHYDDPVAYRRYIAEHQLSGNDTWNWNSEESLLRYRAQRRNITQASQRANTVLAVAIVNRLVSALHVARAARDPQSGERAPRSWNLEVSPSPSNPDDATACRLGIRARF